MYVFACVLLCFNVIKLVAVNLIAQYLIVLWFKIVVDHIMEAKYYALNVSITQFGFYLQKSLGAHRFI